MFACSQAVSDARHTNPLKTELMTLTFPGSRHGHETDHNLFYSKSNLPGAEPGESQILLILCPASQANPSFGGRCPNQAQMPSLKQHGQEKFDDKTYLGRKMELKVYK